METSATVLLVGGVASLLYGFVLGLPLTLARTKSPTASRHLVTAHLAAIIQAATLMALSSVMDESDLPDVVESGAAIVLVGGAVLFVSGAIANWRQAIDDHFAVRSLGWKLFATSGPLNLAGATVVMVGVLRGL